MRDDWQEQAQLAGICAVSVPKPKFPTAEKAQNCAAFESYCDTSGMVTQRRNCVVGDAVSVERVSGRGFSLLAGKLQGIFQNFGICGRVI